MIDDASHDALTAAFYAENDTLAAKLTSDIRFAHYTSAETAMKIISGKGDDRALWLRNATEMNDFAEIEYGFQCLLNTLEDATIRSRTAALAKIFGMSYLDFFNSVTVSKLHLKTNTFLLSLSEHAARNDVGKLSMWRAYGGEANVCMVFKTDAFSTPQDAYSVDLVQVDYRGNAGFKQRFVRLLDNFDANLERLRLCPSDWVTFNWILAINELLLSTKNPGFYEEEEWRVIYRSGRNYSKVKVPCKVVSINGIVQLVHYLPFRNYPEHGLKGAELGEILDRVIIGPTPNPSLVREAFVHLLREANVSEPEARVVCSYIPLRR